MANWVMSTMVGLAVFCLGIALLIVAFDALGVRQSEIVLSGFPRPDSPWLLAGGGGAILAGLWLAFTGKRRD